MRLNVKHPQNSKIKGLVGFDRRALGWFAEIRDGGRLVEEYDALNNGETSLKGILDVLIRHEFFTTLDVSEALGLIPQLDEQECEDPSLVEYASEGERLAMKVILDLKQSL